MRIEVRGVPLGVALFQCQEERQTGQNKWTDEQQRERTRQLRYGCGKRREFHYPSIKDLINSPRNHPPSKSRSVFPRYLFSILRGPWPPVSFSHKA